MRVFWYNLLLIVVAILIIDSVLGKPTDQSTSQLHRSQRKKRIDITNNNFGSSNGAGLTITNTNSNGQSFTSFSNNPSAGSSTIINNNGNGGIFTSSSSSSSSSNSDLTQLLNTLPTGSEVIVQNGVISVRRPPLTTALIIVPKSISLKP